LLAPPIVALRQRNARRRLQALEQFLCDFGKRISNRNERFRYSVEKLETYWVRAKVDYFLRLVLKWDKKILDESHPRIEENEFKDLPTTMRMKRSTNL